jgi:hypothetical protein
VLAFQGRNRSSADPVSGLRPFRWHAPGVGGEPGHAVEADDLGGGGDGSDDGGVPGVTASEPIDASSLITELPNTYDDTSLRAAFRFYLSRVMQEAPTLPLT